MKTKTWTKPKLVVLFKGRPEEAVLAGCKRNGVRAAGNRANCGNNICRVRTTS